MNSTVDLLKRNLSLSYVEKSQRRGKNHKMEREVKLWFTHVRFA